MKKETACTAHTGHTEGILQCIEKLLECSTTEDLKRGTEKLISTFGLSGEYRSSLIHSVRRYLRETKDSLGYLAATEDRPIDSYLMGSIPNTQFKPLVELSNGRIKSEYGNILEDIKKRGMNSVSIDKFEALSRVSQREEDFRRKFFDVYDCLASGFESITTEVRTFKELKHWADIKCQPRFEGKDIDWTVYPLLASPDSFEGMTELFSRIVDDNRWNPTTICAISASAGVVASPLNMKLKKDFLLCDWEEKVFFPRIPQKGERILVFDTCLQSGETLHKINEKLVEAGCNVVGNIVIALNDIAQERLLIDRNANEHSRYIDGLIREGKLFYFTTLRTLLTYKYLLDFQAYPDKSPSYEEVLGIKEKYEERLFRECRCVGLGVGYKEINGVGLRGDPWGKGLWCVRVLVERKKDVFELRDDRTRPVPLILDDTNKVVLSDVYEIGRICYSLNPVKNIEEVG